jgi:hypothetical protein
LVTKRFEFDEGAGCGCAAAGGCAGFACCAWAGASTGKPAIISVIALLYFTWKPAFSVNLFAEPRLRRVRY